MSAHDTDPIRVAIIEDNHDHQEQLRRRLAKVPRVQLAGCHGSAEEALEQIPKQKPALAFMDILLPGMSGIRGTWLLKRKVPALRIVMMTSVHEEDTFRDCLRHGADGYLLKPIAQAPIEDAIHKALAGIPPIADPMMPFLVQLARSQAVEFATPPGLTRREAEVLKLLARGLTDREMAAMIGVARSTIYSHLHHIYEKLGVDTRTAAVARCYGQAGSEKSAKINNPMDRQPGRNQA